jgi:hypothetical protein
MSETTTEVSKPTPIYTTETLSGIKSFEDAMAVLEQAGVSVTDITDYGDGFAVVDKRELVSVPFIVIDWKFADGKFGEKFAIVRAVTKDNRKVIFTDGSETSGVRPQILDFERKGSNGGILCPKGLTVSEYEYVDDKGVKTPAKTYYFTQA